MMRGCVAVSVATLAALVLSSCATPSDKKHLADRLARTCAPYKEFADLYKDLHRYGAPGERATYEQYIHVKTGELCERLSSADLQEAIRFYESPLGQELLKHGRQSKANLVLFTAGTPRIWTCPQQCQIGLAAEGKCPICGQKCVPMDQ